MKKMSMAVLFLVVATSALAQGTDPGYAEYRGWGDPTGRGIPHYCRVIGNPGSYTLSCLRIGSTQAIESGSVDRGYSWGAQWVDINADGKTDYCRIIGSDQSPLLACNLSTGSGFTATLQSTVFSDAGYHDIRGWYGGKTLARYCRGVGDRNRPQITCQAFTISSGTLILKNN